MPQHPKNLARANRAESLLKAGKYWDCGESYAIADALSDLMHLADKHGWQFDELLDDARNHYQCEIVPDDIELASRESE